MHETNRRTLLAGWSFAVAACSTGHAPEASTEVSALDQIIQPLEDHIRHVLIYHEPDYFAAWPANHGIWAWGTRLSLGSSAPRTMRIRISSITPRVKAKCSWRAPPTEVSTGRSRSATSST